MHLYRWVGTFVVCVGDGSESLLAGGVPDLELDVFVVDVEGFEAEVYADCCHVVLGELVVGETEEETGFADGGVADDDVFEEVVVLTVTHGGSRENIIKNVIGSYLAIGGGIMLLDWIGWWVK